MTNTGNVPLSGITVTDSDIGAVTCPAGPLQPGVTRTLHGDRNRGPRASTRTRARVRATGARARTVTDADPSHYFGVAPGIDIEKATNGEDADAPPGPFISVGGTVTWTYVVTNTGNEALNGITVTDNQIGASPARPPPCLLPRVSTR